MKENLGKVIKIEKYSSKIRVITLKLKYEIQFNAGQFIYLIFNEGKNKYISPYSISSSPSIKKEIQLTIKFSDGDVTKRIWKLKVGDIVRIKGPMGGFKFKETKKNKIYFIGAGTGIAPLRSMILDIFEKGFSEEVILIFGESKEKISLYGEEFIELEKKYNNFKFVRVLSKPDSKYEGFKGYVQHNFDFFDFSNSDIYICGMPEMVKGCLEKLSDIGVEKKNIFYEKY